MLIILFTVSCFVLRAQDSLKISRLIEMPKESGRYEKNPLVYYLEYKHRPGKSKANIYIYMGTRYGGKYIGMQQGSIKDDPREILDEFMKVK
jgi:hypothetical protein